MPESPAAASGEMLVARVTVGPLKVHERIIVRTRSGEIAGSVSPFGAQARQNTGVYTVPIPEGAIKDGHVRLLLQVEQKDAQNALRPQGSALHRAAWLPATNSGGKQ